MSAERFGVMQEAGYVKQAFGAIARRYVLTNHVLSLGTDILWRRKAAALVASFAPSSVLDLATGSGDLAIAIQNSCPTASVLGMDFSVPMMQEARKKNFRHLIAADALSLPVQDDSFDVVTVAFGLRNMASWPGALGEMRRVLRPGGQVVILDFSLPVWPVIRGLYLFYLKHVMPAVAGLLTGNRDAYRYLCSSIERFPSGREMEALLTQSGFLDAASRHLSLGIATLYSAVKPRYPDA